MSIAAFIIGFLVWFSVPAFLQGKVSAGRFPVFKAVCKWLGIAILVFGVFYGL